jgi:hypothetical protein
VPNGSGIRAVLGGTIVIFVMTVYAVQTSNENSPRPAPSSGSCDLRLVPTEPRVDRLGAVQRDKAIA